MLNNYELMPVDGEEIQEVEATTLDMVEKASVDIQVATAKKFRRNINRCVDNAIAMATMDHEIAKSCSYALPRGKKPIVGPSVHLAKIIASNWGNLRTESKVVRITDKHVISRGTCWDLENNVASAFEVRRSIVDKDGKRYSDDMITVTGNAANAIAYRNAVFAVIPRYITDRVYDAARTYITGDLSNENKIIKVRQNILTSFKNYNISEAEVLKLCGKQTIQQIGPEEISLLIGFGQSLKDGDTTVEQLMAPFRTKENIEEKKGKMTKQEKLP